MNSKIPLQGSQKLGLSALGLGTWGVGERGCGNPADDKAGIEAILLGLEKGINWIDTAPSYGNGYSERLVGLAMKHLKKRPLISTKCGLIKKNNKIFNNLDPQSIRHEIETSLERLEVDAIDLYQIHKPFPDAHIEQAWQTLAELVSEGKARYAGVSNFNIDQLKRIQAIRPADFIQVHYSMVFRAIENELLPYCRENQIPILAYSPIERGLLAGTYQWEEMKKMSEDHHGQKNPVFADKRNFDLVERLRPIAQRNQVSLSQMAILWILRRPEISSVIVGVRCPSQAQENAATIKLSMPERDWKEIDTLLKEKPS